MPQIQTSSLLESGAHRLWADEETAQEVLRAYLPCILPAPYEYKSHVMTDSGLLERIGSGTA